MGPFWSSGWQVRGGDSDLLIPDADVILGWPLFVCIYSLFWIISGKNGHVLNASWQLDFTYCPSKMANWSVDHFPTATDPFSSFRFHFWKNLFEKNHSSEDCWSSISTFHSHHVGRLGLLGNKVVEVVVGGWGLGHLVVRLGLESMRWLRPSWRTAEIGSRDGHGAVTWLDFYCINRTMRLKNVSWRQHTDRFARMPLLLIPESFLHTKKTSA